MTALTGQATLYAERPKKDFTLRVGANVKIWKGAKCALQNSFVIPAIETTGLKHFCVATQTVDNTGGAAGDENVNVEFAQLKTLVRFLNDTVAPVTVDEIGESCYIIDDSGLVSADDDGGTRSRLGTPWLIIDANDPIGQRPGVYVELDGPVDASSLAALASSAPGMQAVNATLVAGTATINTVITVGATSEVTVNPTGNITGSTNFASCHEKLASRVNGGPGVGTLVVEALGSDGLIDADAAGQVRVVILTPQ